jgi:hypothetical protein
METATNAASVVVPIMGLNSNVLVNGKELHVQTEDLGNGRHAIVTHVFANGGTVVDHSRYDYGEHVGKPNFRAKLARALRAQHDSMIQKLNAGHVALPESTKNELSVTHTQEIIAIDAPAGQNTSAAGASATGTSATGASATGASATATNTPTVNVADKTDVDIRIPTPAPKNIKPVEIAKIALVSIEAPEASKMNIGALPARAHVREETLPYFVENKSTKKRMADDTWSRLVEKAKEEYDKIFNDSSEDLSESNNPKSPQGANRHHPDDSRLGATLPPPGKPPLARSEKEPVGGLGWDAALERAALERSQKAKEAEAESNESPDAETNDGNALKFFDSGLTKIGQGDVRGALVDWSRAVASDPDNKKYRANLHRLLAKMERNDGGAAKGLVLANLFS